MIWLIQSCLKEIADTVLFLSLEAQVRNNGRTPLLLQGTVATVTPLYLGLGRNNADQFFIKSIKEGLHALLGEI